MSTPDFVPDDVVTDVIENMRREFLTYHIERVTESVDVIPEVLALAHDALAAGDADRGRVLQRYADLLTRAADEDRAAIKEFIRLQAGS